MDISLEPGKFSKERLLAHRSRFNSMVVVSAIIWVASLSCGGTASLAVDAPVADVRAASSDLAIPTDVALAYSDTIVAPDDSVSNPDLRISFGDTAPGRDTTDSLNSPTDANGFCTTLANEGGVIQEDIDLLFTDTNYSGGPILDGTYVLTGMDVWINGPTSGNEGTTRRTIRISENGQRIELVYYVSAGQPTPDFNATGTLTTNGTELKVVYDCVWQFPGTNGYGSVTYGYSTSGSGIVLYNLDPNGRSEYISTYTLQPPSMTEGGSRGGG
jgi:hypothetical protein